MLKITSAALATIMGTLFLAPAPALAADRGMCHYCDMEPIVVIGTRPQATANTQASAQIRTNTNTPRRRAMRNR